MLIPSYWHILQLFNFIVITPQNISIIQNSISFHINSTRKNNITIFQITNLRKLTVQKLRYIHFLVPLLLIIKLYQQMLIPYHKHILWLLISQLIFSFPLQLLQLFLCQNSLLHNILSNLIPVLKIKQTIIFCKISWHCFQILNWLLYWGSFNLFSPFKDIFHYWLRLWNCICKIFDGFSHITE